MNIIYSPKLIFPCKTNEIKSVVYKPKVKNVVNQVQKSAVCNEKSLSFISCNALLVLPIAIQLNIFVMITFSCDVIKYSFHYGKIQAKVSAEKLHLHSNKNSILTSSFGFIKKKKKKHFN